MKVSFSFGMEDLTLAQCEDLSGSLIRFLREQNNPVFALIEDQEIKWETCDLPDTIVIHDYTDEQLVALRLAATTEFIYDIPTPVVRTPALPVGQ